jgi:hypothetical protein
VQEAHTHTHLGVLGCGGGCMHPFRHPRGWGRVWGGSGGGGGGGGGVGFSFLHVVGAHTSLVVCACIGW